MDVVNPDEQEEVVRTRCLPRSSATMNRPTRNVSNVGPANQGEDRHKTGVARGQKERGGGDLFRSSDCSSRNERHELVYGFLTERL